MLCRGVLQTPTKQQPIANALKIIVYLRVQKIILDQQSVIAFASHIPPLEGARGRLSL